MHCEFKNIIIMDLKINKVIPKPKEIKSYLDQYVIGQDNAKKTLSVAIYNHYKRFLSNLIEDENSEFNDVTIEKSNVMLIGDTGTGKTFMIKMIAKQLGVPCYIADATKLTESGYVGDDVENIIVGLLQECDYNIEVAKRGIVVIDEIDKISRKSENPSITRDVGGEGVQQGLLKIIEGSVVGVPPQGGRKHPEQQLIYVDTSNILFIGMGAFSGLDKIIEKRLNKRIIGFNNQSKDDAEIDIYDEVNTDDLKHFGLIPELIGRFPVITNTNKLTKEDLCRIITEPKNAILKQYQKLFSIDNIKLSFTEEAIQTIAENCLEYNIGARGLRRIMENVLNDIMYEYSDSNINTINIDKNYILSHLYKNKKKVA